MESPDPRNLTWHGPLVGREERERILGQKGCVVWLTGLSGSGKSTIAGALERRLLRLGHIPYVLDGDNVRQRLNADLGFSPGDRAENIRRLGEVAALFADSGVVTITAFISPYSRDRAVARATVEQAVPARFLEVFLDVDLAECERRDPKGLYQKARRGEIRGFTGIDAPYQRPEVPELVLKTAEISAEESVEAVLNLLVDRGVLPSGRPPHGATGEEAGPS